MISFIKKYIYNIDIDSISIFRLTIYIDLPQFKSFSLIKNTKAASSRKI